MLGIPALLFQGGGAIIDAVCSTQLAEGTTTPHALVGAAALGLFSALCSLAAAIFLGLNRKSMLEMASSGPSTAHSSGNFQPIYDDELELAGEEDSAPHY